MYTNTSDHIASDNGADAACRPTKGDRQHINLAPPLASRPLADVAFQLVTTRAAFDALEADWNDLYQRAGTETQAFQSFNWLWHWANHYCAADGQPGIQPCVLTARRGDRLVMVWPLVTERIRGISQVFWMGEPISQYGDVLIEDCADSDALLRHGFNHIVAHANGDLLRLRRVRADSKVAPLLRQSTASASDKRQAPFLDLASTANYEEFEQRYSGHARRNRKRLARRLNERAPTSFVRLSGGIEARELALKALDLKAEWLKSRGLMSQAFSKGAMRGFFADAAEGRGHKDAACDVTALMCGDDIAAAEISFRSRDRALMHILVYNPKFEKAGAGIVLLDEQYRRSFERGIGVYDMLAPGDAYKLEWTDTTVDVEDWAMPISPAGAAYTYIYINRLRSRLKTAIQSMPGSLRRLLSARVTAVPGATRA